MPFDHATAFVIVGGLYVFVPAIVWSLLSNHPQPTISWWCGGGVVIGAGTIWLVFSKPFFPEVVISTLAAFLFFFGILLKAKALRYFLSRHYSIYFSLACAAILALIGSVMYLIYGMVIRNLLYLTIQILLYLYLAYLCWEINQKLKRKIILWIFYGYVAVVFLLVCLPFANNFGRRDVWTLGWPAAFLAITGILVVFTNNIAYMGMLLLRSPNSNLSPTEGSSVIKSESIFISYFWNSERERILANFSRKLVHEVNQSLTGLFATVALMRRALQDQRITEVDLGEAVNRLNDNLKQIDFIIRQMQPLARSREVVRESVNIYELLLRAFKLTDIQPFEVELESANLKKSNIAGASLELTQVFVNLIHNSSQACGESGVKLNLKIRIWIHDKYFCVSFNDNGPGFPASSLPRVGLEIFTTKKDGMGLGLWISQEIINRHGGRLNFGNNSYGALVELRLPLSRLA